MMYNWLGFERQVAIRFLREGRIQSLLIIVGVAAGVAVFAYISALVEGLQSNTLEKTLGAQAHITLSAPDDVVVSTRAPVEGASALVQTLPRGQKTALCRKLAVIGSCTQSAAESDRRITHCQRRRLGGSG